jgi:regulator of replication initiation timing
MDTGIIKNLEINVGRAIEMVANLKNEKSTLEKENESLRRRIAELQGQLAEQKKGLVADTEARRKARQSDEYREIKARLNKLVGKLAALEDSWN